MSATTSRSESPIYAIPCSSSAGESRCASSKSILKIFLFDNIKIQLFALVEYVDDLDGYAELVKGAYIGKNMVCNFKNLCLF